MQIKNKRIHGKLLFATGVLHTLAALLPGVFGEQFLEFFKKGFFSISKGIAAFPLVGGTVNYDTFAAFWFFYAGPFMMLLGHFIDTWEREKGAIPRRSAIYFLLISCIGAYMSPFSGMTILLIPQAIYMLLRSK